MGTKIGKEKIQREKGYLYFIGKDGYVWAAPMKHNKSGRKKKVGKSELKRLPRKRASCTTLAKTDSSQKPR